MADDNNGSDLSDLKSRLGLNKEKEDGGGKDESQQEEGEQQDQESERAAGGRDQSGGPQRGGASGRSGPEREASATGGGQTSPSSPSPSAGSQGPPGAGPPGGQQGPPGGGPPGAGPGGPAGGEDDALELTEPADDRGAADPPSSGIDDDLSLDEDLSIEEEDTFSTTVLALMAVILVVGVVFGYFAAESLRNRALYQARTDDASTILEEMRPKLENFQTVFETVQQMDPSKVQYDKAKTLADTDVALTPSVLPGNRLLLGRELTGLLTRYMVDSQQLASLLQEHNRLTNQVEREELEELRGSDGEKVSEEIYGIVFDYRSLVQNVRRTGFVPSQGRLARLEGLPGQGDEQKGDNSGDEQSEDEDGEEIPEGQVRFELLNGTESGTVATQSVIPISRQQMRSAVSGKNAFERYRQRMGQIARLTEDINGYSERLVNRFESMANRPAPSLIQLSGSSAPEPKGKEEQSEGASGSGQESNDGTKSKGQKGKSKAK